MRFEFIRSDGEEIHFSTRKKDYLVVTSGISKSFGSDSWTKEDGTNYCSLQTNDGFGSDTLEQIGNLFYDFMKLGLPVEVYKEMDGGDLLVKEFNQDIQNILKDYQDCVKAILISRTLNNVFLIKEDEELLIDELEEGTREKEAIQILNDYIRKITIPYECDMYHHYIKS